MTGADIMKAVDARKAVEREIALECGEDAFAIAKKIYNRSLRDTDRITRRDDLDLRVLEALTKLFKRL